MVRRAAWAAVAATALGCGASVTVRAADAGVAVEAAVVLADAPALDVPALDVPALDVPALDTSILPAECRRPADCEGTAQSTRWCPMSSWSCLDGQCAWECRGGRRCDRAPDGCVRCDGEPRNQCSGRDACAPGWPDAGQMEEATCMRAWTLEPSQCFGAWVRMRDGTLCSLQSLFTGAPRSVLACRRCQTTLLGVEPAP